MYIFPPFSIIGKTLKKIKMDNTKAIVVVPFWKTQHWFPLFLALVKDVYPIPTSAKMLQLPHRNNAVHPLYPKLELVAGRT